jgi:hypothetical protein
MTLRSRFGVPNLVRDVNDLLAVWIKTKCVTLIDGGDNIHRLLPSLPALKKMVNELLDECRDELNALSPPSGKWLMPSMMDWNISKASYELLSFLAKIYMLICHLSKTCTK